MSPDGRYFFIHVMKTGGGTFRQHIYRNFGAGEVYPDRRVDDDMLECYYQISMLLELSAERKHTVRAFGGHFPFCAVEMLGVPVVTLTVLREPVERVVSYLKWRRKMQDRERTLDQIYDDPFLSGAFMRNHQAKVFSMSASDRPTNYLDTIDIDDARLEVAKRNLERVDLVGLAEHFDEFLQSLRRYGWDLSNRRKTHVSDEVDVPPALRRRIAADNEADLELYRFAESLHRRRRFGTFRPARMLHPERRVERIAGSDPEKGI